MIDPKQTELIAVLEHQADEAQLARDNAKDRFDIAHHRSQQSSVFRWGKHTAAFLVAGVIGTGGTLYGLKQDAPYVIPVAAGASLSVGLISNSLDDRRQKREKSDWLSTCRYDLGRAETQLRQCVMQYREEEEISWLMYSLGIEKEQILGLREWMADPRRTMKDAIAESIDIVTEQFLKQPPQSETVSRLLQERENRQMRQRLFSETLQLQKDEFVGHVFSKHNLLRDRELKELALNADLWSHGVSIGGGTATGLLAGAGMTALGAGVAGGSTKMAIAHAVSSPLSFAATLGVGVLAAGTLRRWMLKRESDRRQLEAQQFHDAFLITTQILETLTQARTTASPEQQVQSLQSVWEQLNTFKRQELKRQDPQLKEYVNLLSDRLKAYLFPPSTPLQSLQRLFTSRVSQAAEKLK
jgi:hypothetical protein